MPLSEIFYFHPTFYPRWAWGYLRKLFIKKIRVQKIKNYPQSRSPCRTIIRKPENQPSKNREFFAWVYLRLLGLRFHCHDCLPVFCQVCSGFLLVYPASFLPLKGGGDLNRNQVAQWIGIEWRLASEYAGFKSLWILVNLRDTVPNTNARGETEKYPVSKS
jgi:hypothetical protein